MIESPLTCNRFEPVECGVIYILHGQALKPLSIQYLKDTISKSHANVLKAVGECCHCPSDIGFLLEESDASYFRKDNKIISKISTCGNTVPVNGIENIVSSSNPDSGIVLFYAGKSLTGKKQTSYDEFVNFFDKRVWKNFNAIFSLPFGSVYVARKNNDKVPVRFSEDYVALNLKDCPHELVKSLENDADRRNYFKVLGLDCPVGEHKFTRDNVNYNGFSALFVKGDGSFAVHSTPEDGFVSVNAMNCDYAKVRKFCDIFKPRKVEVLRVKEKMPSGDNIYRNDFGDIYSVN